MDLPLAMSAFQSTFGLVVVFFVVFPLLLHGLIGLAVGRSVLERKENLEYLEGGVRRGGPNQDPSRG